MAPPRVSVLVPAYDREGYLPECLDSVLAQDLDGTEIVVVDDGSTDRTWDVAQDYAARDARIRLVRHDTNRGQLATIRRCLDEAVGEYVKFVYSDDVLFPGSLGTLVATLEHEPGLVLAASSFHQIDGDGRRLPDGPICRLDVECDTVISGLALGDRILGDTRNYLGVPTNVLFRRSALTGSHRGTRLLDRVEFALDVAMWVSILPQGDAAYLVDSLSAYRVHRGQVGAGAPRDTGVLLDWHRLIREAKPLGFLADPAAERAALVHVATLGLHMHANLINLLAGVDPDPDTPVGGLTRRWFEERTDQVRGMAAEALAAAPPIALGNTRPGG
jgi:glycosyltransferase involved in cell wall biosynthesis